MFHSFADGVSICLVSFVLCATAASAITLRSQWLPKVLWFVPSCSSSGSQFHTGEGTPIATAAAITRSGGVYLPNFPSHISLGLDSGATTGQLKVQTGALGLPNVGMAVAAERGEPMWLKQSSYGGLGLNA